MNRTDSITPDEQEMELINRFSRRRLEPSEVYVFPVILCDNEIDRDRERFSLEALSELSKLFVGKTGVFDHDPKGENQTARIFFTEVVTDGNKKTSHGEPYTYVKAKAYMMRSEKNESLIAEIDGGIKKEVSVSCSVKEKLCSVCGKDLNKQTCPHVKGNIYGGKPCHVILNRCDDAYEWSFVAVPAQKNAGVTKGFSEKDGLSGDRREVCRLLYLCDTVLPLSVIKDIVDRADEKKLCELKAALLKKLSKRAQPQLAKSLEQRKSGSVENFKL